LGLEGKDEFIIGILFSLEIIFGLLEHSDEVFNGSSSGQLQLDGVQKGFSVFVYFHLLEFVVNFFFASGKAGCQETGDGD